jgi:hypothetical protein
VHIAAAHDPTLVGALIDALGVKGLAVLLALGWLLLTYKSRAFRRAQWKAFGSACRAAWRMVRHLVTVYRPRRIWPTKEERRILSRLAGSTAR